MAETKQAIKAAYPLPAYNYRVTIQAEAGSSVISFVEISGLNMQYEEVVYKHGLSYTTGSRIVPGMRQPIRITMRQGITQDRVYLLNWMKAVYNNPDASDKKRDILIDLCDEKGGAVVRWTVTQAMPVKYEAPNLNASTQEAAISTLELVAHDLQMLFVSA